MRFGLLPAAFGLVLATGCSSSDDRTSVSGKVTHNGSPLGGAKLVFQDPAASGPAEFYQCVSADDGSYSLPAIKPGSYVVLAFKLVPKKGAKLPSDMDAEQIEASGLGVNTLPKVYANPKTSKLAATIKPGKNDVPIDLQEK